MSGTNSVVYKIRSALGDTIIVVENHDYNGEVTEQWITMEVKDEQSR